MPDDTVYHSAIPLSHSGTVIRFSIVPQWDSNPLSHRGRGLSHSGTVIRCPTVGGGCPTVGQYQYQ